MVCGSTPRVQKHFAAECRLGSDGVGWRNPRPLTDSGGRTPHAKGSMLYVKRRWRAKNRKNRPSTDKLDLKWVEAAEKGSRLEGGISAKTLYVGVMIITRLMRGARKLFRIYLLCIIPVACRTGARSLNISVASSKYYTRYLSTGTYRRNIPGNFLLATNVNYMNTLVRG